MNPTPSLPLAGKKGLITGIANDKSIAFAQTLLLTTGEGTPVELVSFLESLAEPRNDWGGSISTIARLASAHGVTLVAIGNGTASRETAPNT